MDKITLLIPIYNILNRGHARLDFMLYSLKMQMAQPNIIVIDGSPRGEYRMLNKIVSKYNAKHVHVPMKEFNMPALYNIGLSLVKTKYTATTGADFLFSPNYFDLCMKEAAPDKMLLKECFNLPTIPMGYKIIEAWQFRRGRLNHVPHKRTGENLANGACQLTLTDWFKKWPFDERMSGWGAVDNLQVERARASRLKLVWIKEGRIYHQYHRPEKFDNNRRINAFERNQQIYRDHLVRIKQK